MRYYLIYSAGGGGGEWNGLKRIWMTHVSPEIKSSILIKFGDIFFNHESTGSSLNKASLWQNLSSARDWLYTATNDNFINTSSTLILDSGTAKAVSWIASHYDINCDTEFIHIFNEIERNVGILDKYVDFIIKSRINYAVTLDLPNPFKVRASSNTRLNLIQDSSDTEFINAMANYANELYRRLSSIYTPQIANEKLLTIINGTWSLNNYEQFLSKLIYKPYNIAVGALSQLRGKTFSNSITNLLPFNLEQYQRVHFLGCGGIDKVKILKSAGYSSNKFSVDCSTPINRSFADKISKYYIYNSNLKLEVSQQNKPLILMHNDNYDTPYYNHDELSELIDLIIKHQNGYHDEETFNARAMLMLHNTDVFRQYAL